MRIRFVKDSTRLCHVPTLAVRVVPGVDAALGGGVVLAVADPVGLGVRRSLSGRPDVTN